MYTNHSFTHIYAPPITSTATGLQAYYTWLPLSQAGMLHPLPTAELLTHTGMRPQLTISTVTYAYIYHA